jgi:hypothetical protein
MNRGTLEHIGIDSDFLNRTQRPQKLRESIDKWDWIKFKGFGIAKESH